MEETFNNRGYNNYENNNRPVEKTVAPNGVESLVWGCIASAMGCLGIGLIFGIIGYRLASKGLLIYNENPSMYKSGGLLTAGKITSIVGIALGICSILFWAVYIIVIVYAIMHTNNSYIY